MSYNRNRGGFFNKNNNNKFPQYTESEEEVNDKIRNQIPIITGATGTGKTQLAKVIASHCGYKPMVVRSPILPFSCP